MSGVTVRRGQSTLLDSVDWVVREGERWVVLGPNGAGKSTLIQIAATLLHPTAGVVVVLEEYLGLTDVFDLRPRIGLVGAGLAATIPRRESVRDAVVTASWGVTGRWRETYDALDLQRAENLLDDWGMDGLHTRTFGTLSEGERKRTQIARALMSDPELLLLDEPTAGLDLGGREDLLSRLALMSADPTAPTVVMVTHHVEEIPESTTHALLLGEGRVRASGPIEDVITSARLTETYATPIQVQQHNGRWSAWGARTSPSG
jgi:iron complex transport system ATP-binding protein